ncbi:MAG: hypothetical protein J1F11_05520 [Oscillospiraceae bacterium]|nr:hypothetical protein [Oscillospiraceae bacterium]
MSDRDPMMKFFANLDSIGDNLRCSVKKGRPLPKGAAEATSRFNDTVQELELASIELRECQTE